MEERLKEHLVKWAAIADEIKKDKYSEVQRKELTEELLIQIGFFQHERFVHLIVTVTFAILGIISIMTTVMVLQPALFLLDILVIGLLIPYIRHYYILENGVQKLYGFYDVIRPKM